MLQFTSVQYLNGRFPVNQGVGPSGKYLLGLIYDGEKTGIYEVSISDKRCIPLLPGVATLSATFARDGKSFLYALSREVKSRFTVRVGAMANLLEQLKSRFRVPFSFPLGYLPDIPILKQANAEYAKLAVVDW